MTNKCFYEAHRKEHEEVRKKMGEEIKNEKAAE